MIYTENKIIYRHVIKRVLYEGEIYDFHTDNIDIGNYNYRRC